MFLTAARDSVPLLSGETKSQRKRSLFRPHHPTLEDLNRTLVDQGECPFEGFTFYAVWSTIFS